MILIMILAFVNDGKNFNEFLPLLTLRFLDPKLFNAEEAQNLPAKNSARLLMTALLITKGSENGK